MNKVVYLIASHKNPEQTSRLAKVIRNGSPNSLILVHHDHSSSAFNDSCLEGLANVVLVPNSVHIEWGGISMIKMVLHCIRYMLDKSITFDWLVLISGQDYPVKSLQRIEQDLAETEYDGFMTYFSLFNSDSLTRKLIFDRYYFRYFKLPTHWRITSILSRIKKINERQPFVRIFPGLRNASPRIGFRRYRTIFSESFQCCKGQFWFMLNRKSVCFLENFLSEHPDTLKYYSRSMIPDESLIQTILSNNEGLKIKNDHLRFMDWSVSNLSHPKVLGIDDFEEMVSSGAHFARKFDIAVDSDVLDMLDEYNKRVTSQ